MISLDNEPDLWQSTHARLRGDTNAATQSGQNPSYAEMVQRTSTTRAPPRTSNANAVVFGPVNYGWQGTPRLQNAPDHDNRDFLDFYLAQMAEAGTSPDAVPGRRARRALVSGGAGQSQPDGRPPRHRGGHRCRRGRRSQAGAAQPVGPGVHREQLDRERQPARVLPSACCRASRTRSWLCIPDSKLAITEYNYGAGNHISGAIAQADVLGIFGRQELFAAVGVTAAGGQQQLHLRRLRGVPQLRRRERQLRQHQHPRHHQAIRSAPRCTPASTRATSNRMVLVCNQQERCRADRRYCDYAWRAVPHRSGCTS